MQPYIDEIKQRNSSHKIKTAHYNSDGTINIDQPPQPQPQPSRQSGQPPQPPSRQSGQPPQPPPQPPGQPPQPPQPPSPPPGQSQPQPQPQPSRQSGQPPSPPPGQPQPQPDAFYNNYNLKPNTIIMLVGLISYLMYNFDINSINLVEAEDYTVAILSLIICEIISPNESIFTTVTNFINQLFIYIGLSTQSGGSNSNESFKDKIINKIVINLTELINSNDQSIEHLKIIIEKNKSIKKNKLTIKSNTNTNINTNIDENIDITKSKYFEEYNKIKLNIPYKLSTNTNNKILSIITKIEKLRNQVDNQYDNIIEYTKIISGLESKKVCNIIDINGHNRITENTIHNCVNDYKKLIKKTNIKVDSLNGIFNILRNHS